MGLLGHGGGQHLPQPPRGRTQELALGPAPGCCPTCTGPSPYLIVSRFSRVHRESTPGILARGRRSYADTFMFNNVCAGSSVFMTLYWKVGADDAGRGTFQVFITLESVRSEIHFCLFHRLRKSALFPGKEKAAFPIFNIFFFLFFLWL